MFTPEYYIVVLTQHVCLYLCAALLIVPFNNHELATEDEHVVQ